MCPILLQPLFTYGIVLLLIAAALLLSQGVAPGARKQAASTILTSCLLALFASFIEYNFIVGNVPGNADIHLLLPLLATITIALPLLDRTRHTGLMFAAAFGGLCLVNLIYETLPPYLPRGLHLGLPRALFIAATMASLIGSMKLTLHPARYTATGDARWQAVPSGILLTGWTLFAIALVLITLNMLGNMATLVPMAAAAITSALVVLFVSDPARDSLHKTGEAFMAGILIVMAQPLSLEMCILLGFIAGFFVSRSEAIALSLRIDDPLHLIGALLIPSFLGILLQGIVFDITLLDPLLQWLGATLATGIVVGLLLWPITAVLFGFAARIRRPRGKSTKD